MKRLLGIIVLGVTLILSGCTSTPAPNPGQNAPSTDGNDVTITEITGEELDEMIASVGGIFDEFNPALDGNVVTFFTSGSSNCKPTPIAAKADVDATKIAFIIYDQNTQCTNDFGVYGWRITFNDTEPFTGAPFVRCEADTCYNDADGTEYVW